MLVITVRVWHPFMHVLTFTCGFSAEFRPDKRSKHELESKSTRSTAMVKLSRTRLLVIDPVELSFIT